MNQKRLYAISEVATILGIQEHRINYAHRTRKVASPQIFSGRRMYRWSDIQRLAQHFKVALPQEEGRPCT